MDLSRLSEQERQDYYEKVCASVGLDPKLRLLEFILMDSGDGNRKLVLYALRGATDAIRNLRGISISKLTKEVGDGYISFQAEGADKTGRTEIAIGAASTRGQIGEALSKSVMIAQTRALRRLTLQFVGGAILDESELNEKTTNISSVATLPTPIMPSVAPSSAPAQVIESVTPTQVNFAVSANADIPQSQRSETRKPGPQRKEIKMEVVESHTSYLEDYRVTQSPKKVEESRAHEAMAELETIPHTVPKPPTIEIQSAPFDNDVIPTFRTLTKEEVNQKIFHYRTEVLEPAGLAPSSGMGVFAKIKAAMKKVTNTEDEKSLENWDEFFRWIDAGITNADAKTVVQRINEVIGATE